MSEPPASLAANVMKAVKAAPAPVVKRKRISNYHIGRWAVIAACLVLAIIAVPHITGRFSMGDDSAPAEANHELPGFSVAEDGSEAKVCEGYGDRLMSDDENNDADVVSLEPAPTPFPASGGEVCPSSEDAGDTVSFTKTFPPDVSQLKNYEAVAEIIGELPDFLTDYTQKDNSDGTYDIIVPAALLEEIKNLDIAIYVNEESDCDEILIIYVP